jgi:RNA polymerase sigma-70 factor (ECF subfamily)
LRVKNHLSKLFARAARLDDVSFCSPGAMHVIGAEDALVVGSGGGDRAAFEDLVRRTARLLFARAYLETGDSHRAEDLVQETFLIGWRSIKQVTDAAGFRPWLLSILHSAVVDAARREHRKKRAGTRVDERVMLRLTSDAPSPADSAGDAEQRQRALSVLRSLPEEYRQVLMLRYLAGADYDTIARQLALSNGSLRGLLHRGMAMLRTQLTKAQKAGTRP